ncbi:DUF6503 family protein [Seonamhaeicola sp. ML3]|uniref:DUF6503 family protein n=1 Tax=Seonamhaeicola sp. ML3 TaxID=2937786 RepID=UPI00200F6DED|nr:DUF6503 family protein [Seonamhaeicola sp. ML3]
MTIRIVLFYIGALILFGCDTLKPLSADEIVTKSIEKSGGVLIEQSKIDFEFRNINYTAIRNSGTFKLCRNFTSYTDTITDCLSNDGFKRFINGATTKIPDSMVTRYLASVNSVHYFSVLPYGLNGKAVNKTYLKKVKIKGKEYHKIKITFNEDGGGEDFEDVFLYFFDTATFKVDYLAYSYEESHGVGLRFREVYNERFIKGVRFVDYNNYGPKNENAILDDIEVLFQNDELKLVSKIELEDVNVTLGQF